MRESISSDKFGISVTAPPKWAKQFVWRYCYFVALETGCVARCTRNRHTYFLRLALSKMVRSNAPKPSTKTAIIRSNLRGDRDTMHASTYNAPRIARHTHSSTISGPTFDGCSCRRTRSASMSAPSLNLYSATEYRSEEDVEQQRGTHASLTEPVCQLDPPRAWAVTIPHASSHPIVELADYCSHLPRYSEASVHLPKKCAIDKVGMPSAGR